MLSKPSNTSLIDELVRHTTILSIMCAAALATRGSRPRLCRTSACNCSKKTATGCTHADCLPASCLDATGDRPLPYRKNAQRHCAASARPAGDSGVHSPLSQAELAVAFQQKQQALLEAVRALPECCRDVFILHRLYHLPQAEVASRLGISRSMVARHMARAVAGLAPVMHAG